MSSTKHILYTLLYKLFLNYL